MYTYPVYDYDTIRRQFSAHDHLVLHKNLDLVTTMDQSGSSSDEESAPQHNHVDQNRETGLMFILDKFEQAGKWISGRTSVNR